MLPIEQFTVSPQMLSIVGAILILTIIGVSTYFIIKNQRTLSTPSNVAAIQASQLVAYEGLLGPFMKKSVVLTDFITGTPTVKGDPMTSEEKILVNFAPLTVLHPGFIGPLVNGVFSEKEGVKLALQIGARCFVLPIDYHDEASFNEPLFPAAGQPCLLLRDAGGAVKSLNAGRIKKITQTIADLAFNSITKGSTDPFILVLHFVKTPDSQKNPKGFLKFCSQVAKELAPLTQYHLRQTPQGSYTRQERQDQLLYMPLDQVEKKVLIFSNLDTSLFRTSSYKPNEDLDYWINLRLFKESTNSLGLTQQANQNQFVRGMIDTLSYYTTIPKDSVSAMVEKTKIRWSIALPVDKVSVADIKTAFVTVGVNSVPLLLATTDSTVLEHWRATTWVPKPKLLRFTPPQPVIPQTPSPKLNSNQGKITAPK